MPGNALRKGIAKGPSEKPRVGNRSNDDAANRQTCLFFYLAPLLGL
jgi:hypothetical protein